MENYIDQPLTHPSWNPSKGDYYSEKALEEERLYKRRMFKKKLAGGILAFLHFALLMYAIYYFS